jgi:hypothetical protein
LLPKLQLIANVLLMRCTSLFRYDAIQRALYDDIEELEIDLDINANDRSWADNPNIEDLKINLD